MSSSSSTDPFDTSSDSATNSISGAVIVSIILGFITTVAVLIAIIYCLKKTGDATSEYAKAQRIHNRNQPKTNTNVPRVVISDLAHATMERFLDNIAKDKPIRFSPQELEEITHNFSHVLGSGGFGVVYKGEFPNGIKVAVKQLKGNISKRVEEQFMAEVSSLGKTHHVNLVKLHGFCFDPTMRALVYEYMEKGSLDKFLFGDQNKSIEWEKLHEIAIGTAKGIAYLHEECDPRIIHYDIKPGNVLLDASMKPKVADFGLAKLCNRDNTHVVMSGCRGTPGYAAPELWTPYPVTHKCDVYSFGMLLFEIVGRRKNHDDNLSGSSKEWLPKWAYNKLNEGELQEMLDFVGIQDEERAKAERMVKVALWCIQYLPKARPMMSSVVMMLEGGFEIDPPPSPFDHLEDNYVGLNSDSSDKSSSSNGTKSNQLEIQVATW